MRNVHSHRYSILFFSLLTACQMSKKPDQDNASETMIVGGLEFSSVPAVGVLAGKEVRCTGTLITPTKVVTAAHCLNRVASPEELSFSIGKDAGRPQSSFKVKAMSAHPHYRARGSFNDIALIELAEPAPASIKPLTLLQEGDSSWEKKDLFVIGYGYSDGLGQKGSGIKRAVWLPISALSPHKILSNPKDGKSTCQGDSGGPAFVKASGVPEGFALAGITIAGSDTRCKGNSIFLRIDAYRAFIEDGKSEAPGPAPDPCAVLGESQLACSSDGSTPSPETGRYRLSCRLDPWETRLLVEDCQAQGSDQICRAGSCQKAE